jgi:hypothetical protein
LHATPKQWLRGFGLRIGFVEKENQEYLTYLVHEKLGR